MFLLVVKYYAKAKPFLINMPAATGSGRQVRRANSAGQMGSRANGGLCLYAYGKSVVFAFTQPTGGFLQPDLSCTFRCSWHIDVDQERFFFCLGKQVLLAYTAPKKFVAYTKVKCPI
jgi:hypothetical protein